MEYTVLNIYSLFSNIRTFIRRKKKGDVDLDKPLAQFVYDKSRPYMKLKYKALWNEYANYFFTYEELKLFILYEYLFRTDVLVINITSEDVKSISKILSEEQYEKDKVFLKALNERFGYKSIKDFFKFDEKGQNVIYMLTKKKTISPMVYIKFIDEIENNETDEEYKQFTKVIRKLKQLLYGETKHGKIS